MRQRVSGIIIKEGKILLIRRVKEGREYFVFPGGGVEDNESVEEALVRELKEEASIDIQYLMPRALKSNAVIYLEDGDDKF
jgi:8-oxo-dGTP diphosphatase